MYSYRGVLMLASMDAADSVLLCMPLITLLTNSLIKSPLTPEYKILSSLCRKTKFQET